MSSSVIIPEVTRFIQSRSLDCPFRVHRYSSKGRSSPTENGSGGRTIDDDDDEDVKQSNKQTDGRMNGLDNEVVVSTTTNQSMVVDQV